MIVLSVAVVEIRTLDCFSGNAILCYAEIVQNTLVFVVDEFTHSGM